MWREYMAKLFGRWLLLTTVLLAVAYLGAILWGSFLPARLEASADILINRPPENVWWVLTDYNNQALWHPQYKEAQATSGPGDKPIRWLVRYTDGQQVNIEVQDENYPTHLVERIADTGLPFAGGWTVDLERSGGMCQVTVHSRVEIHKPLDRLVLGWFVKPNVELEQILAALRRRVESSTVKPSPAAS